MCRNYLGIALLRIHSFFNYIFSIKINYMNSVNWATSPLVRIFARVPYEETLQNAMNAVYKWGNSSNVLSLFRITKGRPLPEVIQLYVNSILHRRGFLLILKAERNGRVYSIWTLRNLDCLASLVPEVMYLIHRYPNSRIYLFGKNRFFSIPSQVIARAISNLRFNLDFFRLICKESD